MERGPCTRETARIRHDQETGVCQASFRRGVVGRGSDQSAQARMPRRRCGNTRRTRWSTTRINHPSRDGNVVEVRPTTSNKRPLEPDSDDDEVCDLEVCDELNENNQNVDDADDGFSDEMTGAPLLRDDVAKAGAEEMTWCDTFEAHEDVAVESCFSRTGRKPISCQWKDINKGDAERVAVRRRLIPRTSQEDHL